MQCFRFCSLDVDSEPSTTFDERVNLGQSKWTDHKDGFGFDWLLLFNLVRSSVGCYRAGVRQIQPNVFFFPVHSFIERGMLRKF